MYQKARDGYTILEFVSEEKCPRFCLCRRPLLFFGHFLQRHTGVSVSVSVNVSDRRFSLLGPPTDG